MEKKNEYKIKEAAKVLIKKGMFLLRIFKFGRVSLAILLLTNTILLYSQDNRYQAQINQANINFKIQIKELELLEELEKKSGKQIIIKNKKDYTNPLLIQQAQAFVDEKKEECIFYIGNDIDNFTLAHEIMHCLLSLRGYFGTSTGHINDRIEQRLKFLVSELTSFILDQYVDYEMKLRGYDLENFYDSESSIVIEKLKLSPKEDENPSQIIHNAVLCAFDIFRYIKRRKEIREFFQSNMPNGFSLCKKIYKEIDIRNSNPIKCQLQIKEVIDKVDQFFITYGNYEKLGDWTDYKPILKKEDLDKSWKNYLEYRIDFAFNRFFVRFYNKKNQLLYKTLVPPQITMSQIKNELNQYDNYDLKDFLDKINADYFLLN